MGTLSGIRRRGARIRAWVARWAHGAVGEARRQAQDPLSSEPLLAALATSSDYRVRLAVVAHPTTPPHALQTLAQHDPDGSIRTLASRRVLAERVHFAQRCPDPALLAWLACDNEPLVRAAVEANPHRPRGAGGRH